MTKLLLLVLIITETAFAVFELTRSDDKREWSKRRLIADGAELAAFAAMLLLPDIDLSFRFKGLALILLIRLGFGALIAFLSRNNTKAKSKPAIVMSALSGILCLGFAMAPALIFKSYEGRPLTGEYTPESCSAILTDSSRTEQFETDGSLREVPVHIFYPAETDSIENGSLPLVIFSHGAFGWYQSNMSTYQELASCGYLVVSMEHPYHSLFTKDTSGKTIIVDMNFIQTVMELSSRDTDSEDDLKTTGEWMELREADMNFALDALKKAADENDLGCWTITSGDEDKVNTALELIDTSKIGLMGHSLGGATAVTVGRREDISAVIDLDGTMLGEQIGFENGSLVINSEPYKTPLFSLEKEDHYLGRMECKDTGYVYANNVILDNAEQAFSTYVKGSEHMDFTDLPLISPFLAEKLGKGSVDTGYCIDTMNGLVRDFFDCYLKGKGDFSVNENY